MRLKKYIKEKGSTVTVAFWISPDGEVIGSIESHIQQIIMNADKFGLNVKDIRSTFKKYNEPVGHEGKAREEIIEGLLTDGWIRIRKYPNSHYSVSIASFHIADLGLIIEWAQKMLDKGIEGFKENDKSFPVIINPLVGKVQKKTIKELADYAEVPNKKLKVIDMLENFPVREIESLNEKIRRSREMKKVNHVPILDARMPCSNPECKGS